MSRVLAVVADLGAAAAIAARAGPLSVASEQRLARIGAARRRSQSTAARQLAALAASRLLGRDVPAAAIEEAGDGAGLRLRDRAGVSISIAHSGTRVAVAVSAAPVGIDVECCDATRDCLALARHACSAAEVDWLERMAPNERTTGFYLLWTLREAAFKAGLRPAVLRGEICLDPDSAGAQFCWASREVSGYRVSVVAPEPVPIEWLQVAGGEVVLLGATATEDLGTSGATPAG